MSSKAHTEEPFNAGAVGDSESRKRRREEHVKEERGGPTNQSQGKKHLRFDGDGEEKPLGSLPKLELQKYSRGSDVSTKGITNKKLKGHLKQETKHHKDAARAAARAEMLLTEEAGYLEAEGMERTYKFKQSDIAGAVDLAVAKKSVELTLDTYGPYSCSYTRSGRHMLLGGEKGHLAVVDWNTFNVTAEFHVGETVNDVSFLHNQSLFAVAQKKYAYIYDNKGTEIHCLRSHVQPLALQFLPYHFLLASLGNAGFLKYTDVSTGALVAEHRTKQSGSRILRQNPWNAVLNVGHGNGIVSMWTPNMSTAVVKFAAHRGPVTALAVDSGGKYLVTAGMDARLKVWDIRKFRDEPVYNYFLPSPCTALDVSQRGMVAVAFGGHLQLWGRDMALECSKTPVTARVELRAEKEEEESSSSEEEEEEEEEEGEEEEEEEDGAAAKGKKSSKKEKKKSKWTPKFTSAAPSGLTKAAAPYMRHQLPGQRIHSVRFRPYDDVLAIGHTAGLASILVPGAGEPNYDSKEADPFQAKKAREEAEVHALLDKLAPSTITLDPTMIATVDRAPSSVRDKDRRDAEEAARRGKLGPDGKLAIGSGKAQRRRNKKTANVITAQRAAIKEKALADKMAQKELEAKAARKAAGGAAAAGGAGGGSYSSEEEAPRKSALSRFYTKK